MILFGRAMSAMWQPGTRGKNCQILLMGAGAPVHVLVGSKMLI
jgi:hypothetical protein